MAYSINDLSGMVKEISRLQKENEKLRGKLCKCDNKPKHKNNDADENQIVDNK